MEDLRPMKTTSIFQTLFFEATPQQLYDTLMSSEKHSELTDSEATIGESEGDYFSTYDGYIHGINLELKPGRRIVQRWQAEEDDWPDGHLSKVTFELIPENSGTRLEFKHEEIPDGMEERFVSGWEEFYWVPLEEYFS
jgi:activator of HSP90 ATPase